jgi:CDP-diacylglycerol--serine O-phosphatidyltransferase
MVLTPAALMVSTIRFRSFKTFDLQSRRPYTVILLIAGGIALIAMEPRVVLVVLAYSYLASAFIGMAITRVRRRGERPGHDASPHTVAIDPPSRDASMQ